MGSIDYGVQEITVDYQMTATSFNMNKWFQGVVPTGIYAGGVLTVTNGTVYLPPFTAVISDGTHQIRVKTSSNITITGVTLADGSSINASTPYVVLKYTHASETANYVDVKAVAAPSTNDLVVGQVILTTPYTVAHTTRSYPRYVQLATGAAGSRDAIHASQVDTSSIQMNSSNQLEVTNWTVEHNPLTGTHKNAATTTYVDGKIATTNTYVDTKVASSISAISYAPTITYQTLGTNTTAITNYTFKGMKITQGTFATTNNFSYIPTGWTKIFGWISYSAGTGEGTFSFSGATISFTTGDSGTHTRYWTAIGY